MGKGRLFLESESLPCLEPGEFQWWSWDSSRVTPGVLTQDDGELESGDQEMSAEKSAGQLPIMKNETHTY